LQQIDLWTWNLGDESTASPETLSEAEQARAARFIFPRDAARFVSAHRRTRAILSEYLDCAPAAIQFDAGAQGKPYLSATHRSDLQFNLSHSDELAMLAVAHGLEVGADIEFMRPVKERVEELYFSSYERAALANLPPQWANRGFFECWTSKEAFVKALGGGMSIRLDSFDVAIGPDVPERILRIEGHAEDEVRAWRLWRFEPALGFMGAVAARTGGQSWELRLRTSG
jgi:4'-phosphopantetheinyl transferase